MNTLVQVKPNTTALRIQGQKDVVISDQTFVGDGTGSALEVVDSENITILNCNGRNLLKFLTAVNVRNLKVIGGDISEIRNNGIMLAAVEKGHILGTGFHNFDATSKFHRDAIQGRTPDENFGPCKDIVIEEVGIRGSTQGVFFKGAHERVTVCNSQFCIDFAQAIGLSDNIDPTVDNCDIRSGYSSLFQANIDTRGATGLRFLGRTLVHLHAAPNGRVFREIVYGK